MSDISILYIESNSKDFEYIEKILNESHDPHFTIMQAKSIDIGRNLMFQQNFDGVVLSLNLPNSSGGIYTLFEYYREVNNSPPLIISTEMDNEEFGEFTVENVVLGYIVKRKILPHEILHQLSLFSEVSNEKTHLELEMIQSEKMDAVRHFAGGVAHDLNNILQTILGFSELLCNSHDSNSTEYSYTKEIFKSANCAASLADQLISISSKQCTESQDLNLNEVIESRIKILRDQISEKYEFIFHTDDSIQSIFMDQGQLDQLIMNLCINSIECMDGEGCIEIQTSTVYWDEDYCSARLDLASGEHALLTITDSGCGMNEEVLSRIFEPYFTTKNIGKGIGLAIVYGIIKQNNCHIHVESEVGSGTKTYIYFPVSINPKDPILSDKKYVDLPYL